MFFFGLPAIWHYSWCKVQFVR